MTRKVNIGGMLKVLLGTTSFYGENSVTDLAKELGCARATLSKVLNNKASLSVEMAMKIEARHPGVDVDFLLHAQLDNEILEQREN